jgi:cytoskeletal protein RodZ
MMKETSELLKQTRAEKNLSLEEISSQTKIQLHILRALEDGHVSDFRNTVFIKGFLKQYAKALGLDPVAVVKMFDQEHSGVASPMIKSNPVAKLDDQEIHNKTNVLWFRTSSKFLTVGGLLIVFALVTAIYFFSMKLISYSQETRSVVTSEDSTSEATEVATNESIKNEGDAKAGPADEQLTKEESLSLPEATPAPTVDKDKKTEEKTPTTPAPTVAPSKPKMVTVEAFESVEIEANWSTGKKESIKLKNNGKHIFYYADKLKLQINNGGGVGITTHQKEIGVPGELGQPTTLNFD